MTSICPKAIVPRLLRSKRWTDRDAVGQSQPDDEIGSKIRNRRPARTPTEAVGIAADKIRYEFASGVVVHDLPLVGPHCFHSRMLRAGAGTGALFRCLRRRSVA